MGDTRLKYLLGLDGGGSSTVAVVCDVEGNLLGVGSAGPSNIHACPVQHARENIAQAVTVALKDAGIHASDVRRAVLGLAGAGRSDDRLVYQEVTRGLGLAGPATVVTDVEIALDAATQGRPGVILISGTGSVCFGRDTDGSLIRSGGYGPTVSDEGSAYRIGADAISAVLRAVDGRAAPTSMESEILEAAAVRDAMELPARLRDTLDRPRIAALAMIVLEHAYRRKDAVARAIAGRAEADLADMAIAVLNRLGTAREVYMSGGVFEMSPELVREVASEIRLRRPGVTVQKLSVPPVVGALWRAATLEGTGDFVITGLESLSVSKIGIPKRPDKQPAELPKDAAVSITETRNPRSECLGSMSPREIAGLMNAEDRVIAMAIGTCLDEIATAIEWAASSVIQGGRLVYAGAGTSGRLAVLDASECPPTFGVDPELVTAVIAGGERAIAHSVEGAEDDRIAAANEMDRLDVGPPDTVVGIAASGSTPFTTSALQSARERGARTIALVANPGGAMQQAAHLTICTVVGPEVLTGSTRLKCATAHKMVLNMISTGAMVRAGKVFKNLMVDVQPTNAKLKQRAVRIVRAAAEVDEDTARASLALSGMDVKVSVTMCIARVDADTARNALLKSGGFVDRALKLLEGAKR